jgi:hypothetical protein
MNDRQKSILGLVDAIAELSTLIGRTEGAQRGAPLSERDFKVNMALRRSVREKREVILRLVSMEHVE